jgi:hypothetical protein
MTKKLIFFLPPVPCLLDESSPMLTNDEQLEPLKTPAAAASAAASAEEATNSSTFFNSAYGLPASMAPPPGIREKSRRSSSRSLYHYYKVRKKAMRPSGWNPNLIITQKV